MWSRNMSNVDGNRPVQLNSIDQVFKGRNAGDSEINQGLLKVYGKDNDVTYLLTHIKLPKEGELGKAISVDRDKDGHLTWKIGDKEIAIGSSWWSRLKHNVKKFFSKTYSDSYDIKVTQKIDRIKIAYSKYLELEDGKAEQIRLAQEAKEQRITGLETGISTGEAKLIELQDMLTNIDSASDEQVVKKGEFQVQKDRFLPKATYEAHRDALNQVIETYKNIIFFTNDDEEKIIKAGEDLIGTPLRTAPDRNKKLKEINDAITSIEALDLQIDTCDGIIVQNGLVRADIEHQISAKQAEIDRLKLDLQTEQGIVVEEPDVAPEGARVEPVVLTEEDLAKARAIQEAKDTGLTEDEAKFYVDLSSSDRAIYDHIRHPADGATNCSPFADFMLALTKGRGAIRVAGSDHTSAIRLTRGIVNMRLGGEDVKITLPANLSIAYSVEKQAWTLKGEGLRLEMGGRDINLDGTRFEILEGKQEVNIKVDSNAQKWPLSWAIAASYKNIPVSYDVIRQDALHSDVQVV